jgi:hypothetical protein
MASSAILSLLFSGSSLAHANAGSGSTSCSPDGTGNASVVACINGHNGEKYSAAYAVWADNALNIAWDSSTHNQFIGDTLWFYTSTDTNPV